MYENLGFTDNIFNTKPLSPRKRDLEKFIGRVQDIKNFSVDASSTDSAVIVVTGHRGVGKTSFVNIMGYAIGFNQSFIREHIKISIPKLIPCYHKMQIEPADNVQGILLKSLSSLLFSINRFAEEKKLSSKIPKEIKKLTKWVSEAALSETTAGQFSIGGLAGAGISRSEQYKSLLDIPANVLQNKIQRTVKLARESFKIDGILLNINNVDILDEKSFCALFNQLRDYLFDINGLWSIIIGQPGLYSALYQQAARVAEIISGQETRLDSLSEEDVLVILKKRQKIYSKNSKRIPLPIDEDFIREIYKNSEGEIRPVFKACDDIVRFVFKNNPNIGVINSKQGRPVLKNILQQQLSLNHFKPKDREILRKILETGAFRPKDYRQLSLKSAVEFTNRARGLIGKNLLKKETKGNAAEYMAAGVIHLAKYAGVEI